MNNLIEQNIDDGILRLTMNSSQNRNALSTEMVTQLQAAFDEAASHEQVRVIILAANGSVFCAGHDMKEITNARQLGDGGRAFFIEMMEKSSNMMKSILNHPRPVIADIRAVVSAAGCQMVASCDLAISTIDARFTTPGVDIGLFCSTPMVPLSRNVSRKHAMEMLLTGDMISARRAEQIGLINKAVELSQIDKEIDQLARKIASKSTMTIKMGKAAFYAQAEMNMADAYAHASSVMVENLMKDDACEGIGAFVEKRDPHWSDA